VALPPFFSSRPTQKDLTFNPPLFFFQRKIFLHIEKAKQENSAERQMLQKERKCRKRGNAEKKIFLMQVFFPFL
jgi:hypothetical protein